MIFTCVITLALYVIAEVGETNRIPAHLGPFLGVIFGIMLVAHIANRWFVPDANPVVLPIAALLNGVGYVVIVAWTPAEAKAQAAWVVVGVLLYVATLVLVRHSRDLDRYRYLLLLLAGALLIAPLVPGIGRTTLGARVFVHLGSHDFQPAEIAKILLCIFFASYFAEKKELLAIPSARIGDRLVIDPRPLVPIILVWLMAMGVIGLEDDLGFALLIFAMFTVLLWIATGRWGYLIGSAVLFAFGAFLAAHLFSQVHGRIDTWLHPALNSQLGESTLSLAHGGVGGAGLGLDRFTGDIFGITTDVVFTAVGEGLGLIGASAVVMGFLLFVGTGLRIAQTARSDFSKLLATGLTVIIGFQAFIVMAGVIRILPFTAGIALPFVAYGGSSLVANYILVGVLMRISQEGSSGAPQPGELEFLVAT
ncbi:MAG: FtsW/RodA/SpoVE family cell cycle protein [Actinomycetota bacterium]|nr:FtsW/RodA/SpoVE family cell cycle protein [Actinomycetota bacterium]